MKENLEKPEDKKEAEELIEKSEDKKDEKKEAERLTFEDLRIRKASLLERDFVENSKVIARFAKRLKDKYKNVKEYILYHALSSPDYNEEECKYFDFPGEDSVEEFMGRLENEQAGKEEEGKKGVEKLIEKPEDKKDEKNEVRKSKFEDLKERLRDLIRDNPKEINDKIVKFAKSLRGRYEDSYNECALYHVLFNHDYKKEDYTFFDFSDDDSVEKFIESLEKGQGKAKDEK